MFKSISSSGKNTGRKIKTEDITEKKTSKIEKSLLLSIIML